jgi:hypothetical protein
MTNHVHDMTNKIILEALEQSTPKAVHYDGQRHAQAIELYTLIIVAMAGDAINPELEATSFVLWYGLAQDADCPWIAFPHAPYGSRS